MSNTLFLVLCPIILTATWFTESGEVSTLLVYTTLGSFPEFRPPRLHATQYAMFTAIITTNRHRSTMAEIFHQSFDPLSEKHRQFCCCFAVQKPIVFDKLVDASSISRTRIRLNRRHIWTLCWPFAVVIGRINCCIVQLEFDSCFAQAIGFQVDEFLTFRLDSDFPSM